MAWNLEVRKPRLPQFGLKRSSLQLTTRLLQHLKEETNKSMHNIIKHRNSHKKKINKEH